MTDQPPRTPAKPRPSSALARSESNGGTLLDPHVLLARAIDVGASIETVERLVALAQDVRAVQAREAWYGAMAEFQKTCPAIKKTLTARIQTRQGPGFSYRYAPLDEILSTIQPVLGPLGLSVSWRSPRIEPDRVVISCRVAHALGHVEDSGEVAMPIVTADPGIGATPPQRVGIALTYARRYSLLAIIGLAPEDDDDANGARPNTHTHAERPSGDERAPSSALAEESPPSFDPFGAIHMITELNNNRFDGKLLESYFPGCRTKSALEAYKAAQAEAYMAAYLRLRGDYKSGKAGIPAA
jgi:ERF superfamily